MTSGLINIPENIKQAIFAAIKVEISCAADRELNDSLLDAVNDLDKAFGKWNLKKELK